MTVADRATAYDALEADGQTVTVTRRSAGAYDTTTGSAAITTSTQTAKAVIFPLSQGIRAMMGSDVTSDTVQCLLSALSTSGVALTAPKVGDTITEASGRAWTIIEVAPLSPAGLDILYDLRIKAAGA